MAVEVTLKNGETVTVNGNSSQSNLPLHIYERFWILRSRLLFAFLGSQGRHTVLNSSDYGVFTSGGYAQGHDWQRGNVLVPCPLGLVLPSGGRLRSCCGRQPAAFGRDLLRDLRNEPAAGEMFRAAQGQDL